MRSYAAAVAYAEGQRRRPSRNWAGMCQAFARSCVGANGWAGTALSAWNAIPRAHRHGGTPRPGSLVYFDSPSRTGEAGHAVFMADGGYCYSTDIVRHGKVDKVPLAWIHSRWGMRQLGWIDWTPSGAINLKPAVAPMPKPVPAVDLSALQKAASIDPGAAQGHVTAGSAGSVLTVERSLVAERLLEAQWVDGSYGTKTKEAYAAWQRRCGYSGSGADGVPGRVSLTKLGSRHGFRVVA